MNSCAPTTSTTTPYHYQQQRRCCENLLNIQREPNLHIPSKLLPVPMLQSPLDENVLKTGILKIGRRGQKRFFVVRQDGYNSPARIDRYTSFKNFQNGSKADFTVLFKDVFSVNRTIISKHNVVGIAVFTPTTTMYMGCKNDIEREAWLYVIKNVLRSCREDHFSPLYNHVWDVKLLKTDLAGKQGPLQGGPCRLCFSDCSLFLCPLFASQNSPKNVEFPLICISSFGLSYQHELYLRVGRSAITGPGQMWIVHDEPLVLNDIHSILSKIMLENNELRAKNRSAVDQVIATFQNSRGRAKTMPGDTLMARPNSSQTKSDAKSYARCFSASSIPVDSPYQLLGSSNENSNYSLKELDDSSSAKLASEAPTSHICGDLNYSQNTKENESYVPMFKKDEQDKKSTDYCRRSNRFIVSKPSISNNRAVHELGRIDEYTPMCPAGIDDLSPYVSNSGDFFTKKTYNLEEVKSYIRVDDDYRNKHLDQLNNENVDHQCDYDQPKFESQNTSSSSSEVGDMSNEKYVAERKSSESDKNVVERSSSTVKRANSQRNSISDQQEISSLHDRPPTPTPSTSSLSGFTSFINDIRRRCYSFGGSLSKRLKRKCSGEGKHDHPAEEEFRRRSESFGSHRSKPATVYSYNSLTSAPYSRMTPSVTMGPCGFSLHSTERRNSNYSENFLEIDFGSSSSSKGGHHKKHLQENRRTLSGSSPTCCSSSFSQAPSTSLPPTELTPSAIFLRQMAAEYEESKASNTSSAESKCSSHILSSTVVNEKELREGARFNKGTFHPVEKFRIHQNRNNSFPCGEYVAMGNASTKIVDSCTIEGRNDDDSHHHCSKSLTDMDDSPSSASLLSCCMAENFQRSCSLERTSKDNDSDQSPPSLASLSSKVSDVFESSSITIINDSTRISDEKIVDTIPCVNKTIIRADVHVSSPPDDEILQNSHQTSVRKISKSSPSPKTLSFTKLNQNLNCHGDSQSLASKKCCNVDDDHFEMTPNLAFTNRSISASMLENLLVVDASNLGQIFLQQREKQENRATTAAQTNGAANFAMKTVLAAN